MRGKKGRIAGERRFVNNAEAKTKRTYWWIEVRDATGAWTRTAAGRGVGATPDQRETLAGDAEGKDANQPIFLTPPGKNRCQWCQWCRSFWPHPG